MLLEGCLEIGAKAIAEAFFELQQNSNNQLEGVFYHNGVIANVYVEASFGKSDEAVPSAKDVESAAFSSSSTSNVSKSNTSQTEKITTNTWTIYKKLPQEQSTYKIRLI
jgi:hypothetical protein